MQIRNEELPRQLRLLYYILQIFEKNVIEESMSKGPELFLHDMTTSTMNTQQQDQPLSVI